MKEKSPPSLKVLAAGVVARSKKLRKEAFEQFPEDIKELVSWADAKACFENRQKSIETLAEKLSERRYNPVFDLRLNYKYRSLVAFLILFVVLINIYKGIGGGKVYPLTAFAIAVGFAGIMTRSQMKYDRSTNEELEFGKTARKIATQIQVECDYFKEDRYVRPFIVCLIVAARELEFAKTKDRMLSSLDALKMYYTALLKSGVDESNDAVELQENNNN